jgi:hypothetical protein
MTESRSIDSISATDNAESKCKHENAKAEKVEVVGQVSEENEKSEELKRLEEVMAKLLNKQDDLGLLGMFSSNESSAHTKRLNYR